MKTYKEDTNIRVGEFIITGSSEIDTYVITHLGVFTIKGRDETVAIIVGDLVNEVLKYTLALEASTYDDPDGLATIADYWYGWMRYLTEDPSSSCFDKDLEPGEAVFIDCSLQDCIDKFIHEAIDLSRSIKSA